MKRDKSIVKHIDVLLKELEKNWITREPDFPHSEINLNCPECKARILEGYLSWMRESYDKD